MPKSILNKIKVTPLASESFGVRSMCTLVETPDVAVLLDAGVSLCPWRFSLPPHPIEFQTIQRLRRDIAEAADKATVTTISHYHFDHHTPSYEDWVVNWTDDGETARQIYHDKVVLAKNPKENINASQRQRAWMFQRTGGKHAKSIEAADGKTFHFGDTTLRFSEAVAHGSEGGMLGWVIMATVECGGERFMHAPDVQGPMSKRTTELILAAEPDVIMLGGPPLYLAGFRVEERQLGQGLENLTRIAEAVPLVVLEHHALRDEFWRSKMETVFQKAEAAGHSIVTAAEYAGKENLFLEAKRKQLFRDHPVSDEFKQWTKTLTGKKIAKPPI
ncbi:MAG: MBL fold metallo-hydrolase [Candidatus Bathyarchaeia archaeon]|jgi:predicted metallo-beta-lactamase superfamily hydrolase